MYNLNNIVHDYNHCALTDCLLSGSDGYLFNEANVKKVHLCICRQTLPQHRSSFVTGDDTLSLRKQKHAEGKNMIKFVRFFQVFQFKNMTPVSTANKNLFYEFHSLTRCSPSLPLFTFVTNPVCPLINVVYQYIIGIARIPNMPATFFSSDISLFYGRLSCERCDVRLVVLLPFSFHSLKMNYLTLVLPYKSPSHLFGCCCCHSTFESGNNCRRFLFLGYFYTRTLL